MDILSDENCEGQATLIFYAFRRLGWQDLIPIRLLTFEQANLPRGSDDETVWHFCQTQGYLLLTGNRTANAGTKSLEMVLQRDVTEQSLPILTIGDKDRVQSDATYCEQCATSIATVVWGLTYETKYWGTPRLFVPLPL